MLITRVRIIISLLCYVLISIGWADNTDSSRLNFRRELSEQGKGVYTKYMTETERTDNNADNSSMKSLWFSRDDKNQITLQVDMFISSTCPYCQQESKFFADLETKISWLTIHRHVIDKDKAALETFYQLLRQTKELDFSVPSLFFCNTRWVGFDSVEKSGQLFLKALNYCRTQITNEGRLTQATTQVLKQMANARWYEANLTTKPSTEVFILVMAIADALNSFANFSMITLVAFLMLQKQKNKQLSILLIFLLAIGITHHIQQADINVFYQILARAQIPVMLIGLSLITYVVTCHPKSFIKHQLLSGGSSNKLLFSLVFLTALAVQSYQQSYTPNFYAPNLSLIFHLWITLQKFSDIRQTVYALCYQLCYLATIGIITVGFVAMIRYCQQRWSKYPMRTEEFACHYLVIIGLILIGFPIFLEKFMLSFLLIILAFLSSWISLKFWYRHE